MRKIVTILLFQCCFTAFSQWKDDFTDGNFTSNPAWSGSSELFTVNATQQLQTNASVAGSAYLTLPHSLYKGNRWNIWTKLAFNTSSNNLCRIYIASDNANPALAQSAYYVQMGGTNDKICLVKKTGNTTVEIIPGIDKELDKSSVSMHVRAELTHQSVWRLYVKYSTDADYVLKGEYTDNSLLKGEYTGIQCTYTSSYGKSFYFDDLSIDSIPEKDITPPSVTDFQLVDSKTLTLRFSEPVDVSAAFFILNGTVSPSAVILSSDAQTATLTYATEFTPARSYALSVTQIKDLSGNTMAAQSFPFIYYPTVANATAGDVVISEIMANPTRAAGLPEAEYIELYNNRTDAQVNLSGWKLFYGEKGYPIPDMLLRPGQFVVLCSAANSSRFSASVSKAGMESFPTLANSGKLLYLQSAQGEVVSFAEYSDTWYGDDFKAKGGFSLECIDTQNRSGSATNWRATNDSKGGTPGVANSITAVNPDTERPVVSRTSLVGNDTIIITFSKPMLKSSLETMTNYQLSPNRIGLKSLKASYPVSNAVVLVLSDSIRRSEVLNLKLQQLLCISGNPLAAESGIKVALTEQPEEGDVIINEILFNPKGNASDYVEIFNRSNKVVDLSKLYITSKKTDGTLNSGNLISELTSPLFPGEYLLLTTDKQQLTEQYDCKNPSALLQLPALPSLPDAEGNVVLANSSAQVIDALVYSEKMHHPTVKNAGGVALERISPSVSGANPANWQSASFESGYGTPGYANSQQANTLDGEKKGFWLENETVTPDNNGRDDLLHIGYRLDEAGYTANVRVYSPTGKLISQLATNQILGIEGSLSWNATDTANKLVSPGVYVLFVEYYKTNRAAVRKKMAVVVGN